MQPAAQHGAIILYLLVVDCMVVVHRCLHTCSQLLDIISSLSLAVSLLDASSVMLPLNLFTHLILEIIHNVLHDVFMV